MRLGIDLMGGDLPPQAVFEAVLQARGLSSSALTFCVIAEKALLVSLEQQYNSLDPTNPYEIEFIEAGESVVMEDSPLLALRRKKEASMSIGIQLMKEGKLDALLSTGNTGALVAFAQYHLPLLSSISQPALLVTLPTFKGRVALLDVGANISFKSSHLVEYARMGAAFSKIFFNIDSPRVGLLNIGSEALKGTSEIKAGYQLLEKTPHFTGNIEGGEILQGKVDVVVTEGFVGNVFLKACEGASGFLLKYLAKEIEQMKIDQGASAGVLNELLKRLYMKFSYSEHPGGQLVGVDGLVIKCHGYSNVAALLSGIKGAIDLVERQFMARFKAELK